jgi:hypothetical protein
MLSTNTAKDGSHEHLDPDDRTTPALRMHAVLAACGLDAPEQQLIASGNALRLLGEPQ